MGLNLIDRIQAKIELFRLEQRYTRRRHRRSAFVSNAIYVDGEYIYQSPNTTGSSANTSRTNNSHISTATNMTTGSSASSADAKTQKRLNRWSSMPGFGSSAKPPAMDMPTVSEAQDWRKKRVSFHDER
ncbi:Mso1 N-terminal domain-containing protein [Madurella fahalii]|uniref:Mso1 N-terminal domain-containing protein n=1 Tax=Madurella fahalii TaxID=1157608 RepID=A0ABQ0GGK3_9PEZI